MSFLAGLNDAQRRAVDHCGPPACGGRCGRWQNTWALTHRIAHLIGEHGVDPAQILAVTFTNKAAREMKGGRLLLSQKLAQAIMASLEHPAAGGAASVAFAHLP